jgi:hypothetical protein
MKAGVNKGLNRDARDVPIDTSKSHRIAHQLIALQSHGNPGTASRRLGWIRQKQMRPDPVEL